ncbi:cytochrome P450 [Kitasatospora sp. NPDC056531]|uniref:cytochrome P450 n=1 Tax=Kitasatospora sp. NPDC056531 TaxID=3345856 RepID=UPI0036C2C45A
MTEPDEIPDGIPRYPIPRDPRCPLDPPAAYLRSQRSAVLPRVRIWDGSRPWLVTQYDEAVQALGDSRLSGDARLPGFPLASASTAAKLERVLPYPLREDEVHQTQRAMLMREFTPRKMEALRPRLQGIVDDAVETMLAGPRPADLVAAFATPVAIGVICEVLGVDAEEDRQVLHGLCRTVASRTTRPDEASRALDALEDYFRRLVETQLRRPGTGVVGRVVVERVRSGELSHEDAVATTQLLFHAGHGTSAYTIATGVAALFAHPQQLAVFRAADDITEAVAELLRYTTVAHNGMARVATEDVVIGATLIRAGEGVLIQLDAANRDPSAFPDPDRLDLGRPPSRNLTLGHGPHHCLGSALAHVELQVALGTLFRRIPELQLAVPMAELSFKDNENLVGLHTLPVTW